MRWGFGEDGSEELFGHVAAETDGEGFGGDEYEVIVFFDFDKW